MIAEHDPDRRLIQILSDSNILAEGESFGWELVYDMPSRDRKVIVIIHRRLSGRHRGPGAGVVRQALGEHEVVVGDVREAGIAYPFQGLARAMAKVQGIDLISGSTMSP